MKLTMEFISKGTYSLIFYRNHKNLGKECIYKVYDLGLTEDKAYMLKELIVGYISELAKAKVNVPEIYDITINRNYINRFEILLVQKYAGISIRDLVEQRNLSDEVLIKTKDAIESLSETVPLDINTGNLVWDGTCISYVDVVPPLTAVFSEEKRASFYSIFEHTNHFYNEPNARNRYYNRRDRLKKFYYYLQKDLSKYSPQDTSTPDQA